MISRVPLEQFLAEICHSDELIVYVCLAAILFEVLKKSKKPKTDKQTNENNDVYVTQQMKVLT